jgi:hypothetical protein
MTGGGRGPDTHPEVDFPVRGDIEIGNSKHLLLLRNNRRFSSTVLLSSGGSAETNTRSCSPPVCTSRVCSRIQPAGGCHFQLSKIEFI